MKIVVAPDSFKESLTADQAAHAIEAGFRAGWPEAEILRLPMADGGEGTTAAVVSATGGRLIPVAVSGPLGEPMQATFGLSGDGQTAIVELAAASGLEAVPPPLRNPWLTTTFGTGELIRAALDYAPRRLLIGLGGSATVDGGAGLLQALGARLLDSDNTELPREGGALGALVRIDLTTLDPRLRGLTIEAACDVDTPLYGMQGAARIFGPQKGASPAMVEQLDHNLQHWGTLLHTASGINVDRTAGAGAAGGTGAALLAALGARLSPGAALVADVIGLEAAIAIADLVITGEGRMDRQTLAGKTPAGVAGIANRHGKPVIAFAGGLFDHTQDAPFAGIDAIFSITPHPGPLSEALENAAANLRQTSRNVATCLRLLQ